MGNSVLRTMLAALTLAAVACSGGGTTPNNGGVVPGYAGHSTIVKHGSLGLIFQFPGAPKLPLNIATDGAGHDWFSECGSSTIANIDESTLKYSRFTTPSAKSCYGGVALGRSGKGMWFTDYNGDKIGYIDLATHAFHVYHVPTQYSYTTAITAGPDDAMWFTESANGQHANHRGKIGRIDLSKKPYQITEFSLPYNGRKGAPADIVVGSDGALWFVDSEADGIGSITTGFQISFFPLPSSFWYKPTGIVAGPDGALWFVGFTNVERGYVGRIDPVTHAISSYEVDDTGAATSQIVTLGPDLWFTENQNDKIGCINTNTYQTHLYDLPQGDHPWGITAAKSGWLWIAETVANSLAAAGPSGPCST